MTHPEIKSPTLRKLFAVELLTLRQVFKGEMQSEYVLGIRLGIETALRRVQQLETI